MNPDTHGKHAAPVDSLDYCDPTTCPMCLRTSWIAQHGVRLLPVEIVRHRYVMALVP